MGVNTNIYLLYGWELPMSKEYREYMDKTDYVDIDHTLSDFENGTVWVGVVLDESGDLRWDMPNFSGWEGDSEKALDSLNSLELPEILEELFPHYNTDVPLFRVVTIYT